MEKCERCQIKVATFYCKNCRGYFCTSCDIYLHNLPSKKYHIRNALNLRNYSPYNNDDFCPPDIYNRTHVYTASLKHSGRYQKSYDDYPPLQSNQNISASKNELEPAVETKKKSKTPNALDRRQTTPNINSKKIKGSKTTCELSPEARTQDQKDLLKHSSTVPRRQPESKIEKSYKNMGKTVDSKDNEQLPQTCYDNYCSRYANQDDQTQLRNTGDYRRSQSPQPNNYYSGEFEQGSDNFQYFYDGHNREASENINIQTSPMSLQNSNRKSPEPRKFLSNSNGFYHATPHCPHNLMQSLHILSHEVQDTKQNLDDRINYLHDHIHEVDLKHKEEMMELNSKNLSEINYLNGQNENQVRHLQAIIEDQRDLINKLKVKNSELEISLEDYKKIKDHLCDNNLALKNEKFNMESFYKTKIDEIIHMHGDEKKRMVQDYESEIRRINDMHNNAKEKLISIIQEREEQLRELLNNTKEEKEHFNSVIDSLKNEKESQIKENKDMNLFNDELKENVARLNDDVIKMQDELAESNNEKNELKEKMTKLRSQNNALIKANKDLHNLIYGRKMKSKNKA